MVTDLSRCLLLIAVTAFFVPDHQAQELARIAGGVLWVTALLAAMLSFDRLFQQDAEAQANEIVAELVKTGERNVAPNSELVALISYLQRLGVRSSPGVAFVIGGADGLDRISYAGNDERQEVEVGPGILAGRNVPGSTARIEMIEFRGVKRSDFSVRSRRTG